MGQLRLQALQRLPDFTDFASWTGCTDNRQAFASHDQRAGIEEWLVVSARLVIGQCQKLRHPLANRYRLSRQQRFVRLHVVSIDKRGISWDAIAFGNDDNVPTNNLAAGDTHALTVSDHQRAWAKQVSKKAVKRYERNIAKARTKDSLAAFAKLTEIVDGEPQFISNPPLIVPLDELASGDDVMEGARQVLRSYRRTLQADRRHLLERFRFVDAARKVVGVGSVGTRAWIILFVGRDDHDPLILQMKEAQASVLEPFLGKSHFSNHGQRVVEGQRLMQAASDVLLGWLRDKGLSGSTRDFYVRQLWDQKGAAEIDVMEPADMENYARLCGWTLAQGHARSGDAIAIAGYLGASDTFDDALGAFAETYADQNERDYAALQEAAASGRIQAQTGV